MRDMLLAITVFLLLACEIPVSAAIPTKPKCAGSRVVWAVSPAKQYVLSNNPLYGKKPGGYACESTLVARGYHMRPLNIAQRQGAVSTAATPMPDLSATPENPAVTAMARAQIETIRSGKIDRSQYSNELNGAITDTMFSLWSQMFAVGGAVTSFTYAGTAPVNGVPIAQYAVVFENPIVAPRLPSTNQWNESIAVDSTGKIAYLSFAPKP